MSEARLVEPSPLFRASFVAAVREAQAEGRHAELDPLKLGDPVAFARYVQGLLADALPQEPRFEGWVPQTTLWWVAGDEYLGRVSIRHQLTDSLRKRGGHIGYEIRPAARRRGHATAMLAAALPVAAALGIDPAYLDCDTWNVASRRVIERNGGRLVAGDERMLYFRVPTGDGGPRGV